MVTTTTDVQPGELAARLREAGLSEIDTTARRRAEYSSDASNYRVVPLAVAFPRSADDLVAALTVCRELGVPLGEAFSLDPFALPPEDYPEPLGGQHH